MFRVAVKATGVVPKAETAAHEPAASRAEPSSRRQVRFEGAPHDAGRFQRDDLTAGLVFHGPAIVEQLDSTIVVPRHARRGGPPSEHPHPRERLTPWTT